MAGGNGDIPDEPEFETDLTGLKYWYTEKFQIQLERKEDLEARGLESPDNGDALAMSFAAFPAGKTPDEKLVEAPSGSSIKDPMELHFARLRETQRREKIKLGQETIGSEYADNDLRSLRLKKANWLGRTQADRSPSS